MIQEALTTKDVALLMRVEGMGAFIMSWDINYSVGSVRMSTCERCIWTKKGMRTSVTYDNDVILISQSKEPDPIYKELTPLFMSDGSGRYRA